MNQMNKERIAEILSESKHIAVVGDLMIDEYLWGEVYRISPEAPVPVIEINEEQFRPGGSANVAYNLIHLEQKVTVFGVVGEDRNADRLLSLLESSHIQTDGIVKDAGRPTTIKTRIIGGTQHIARVDKEKSHPISAEIENRILEQFTSILPGIDAVILEDYNKGVLTSRLIREIISLAGRHSIPVTVDPKFQHFFDYKNVTVFKPNKKETEKGLNLQLDRREDVIRAGEELLKRLKADAILITLGPEGMALFEKNTEPFFIDSHAKEVADVSGAGDTVIATLTAVLANGGTLREAVMLANRAAAIVVEQVGVVPIEKQKLIQYQDGEG
jgi:rfaE bifunctional protein kinase chain/domain